MLERAAAIGHPFDLAILDVQMPEMDGLSWPRHIKNNPATSDTLLIVLTSMGQDLSPWKCSSMGLAGYVHKPVRQSRLLDAIVDATSHDVLAQAAEPEAGDTADARCRSTAAEFWWPKTTTSIRSWSPKS